MSPSWWIYPMISVDTLCCFSMLNPQCILHQFLQQTLKNIFTFWLFITDPCSTLIISWLICSKSCFFLSCFYWEILQGFQWESKVIQFLRSVHNHFHFPYLISILSNQSPYLLILLPNFLFFQHSSFSAEHTFFR